MVHMETNNKIYEVLCWNEIIKSFVLLQIPRKMKLNLKNAISLTIKSGKIKTKDVPLREKKRLLVSLSC